MSAGYQLTTLSFLGHEHHRLLRPGLLDLFTEADEDKSPLDHLEDTGWFVSVEMVPAVEFGMVTMPFLLGGSTLLGCCSKEILGHPHEPP